MHQKMTAMNNDEKAYTSASTAENQKESETAYAVAPTKPAPRIEILVELDVTQVVANIFRQNHVIVQNKNMIVRALSIAEAELINRVIWPGFDPASKEAIRPINRNNGFPGAWQTSSFEAQDKNSPQSQKLTEGSKVER